MRKFRFSEAQIVEVIKESEAGVDADHSPSFTSPCARILKQGRLGRSES